MIDEKRYFEIISGREKSVTGFMHRGFFHALSFVYRLVVAIRNRLYDLGIKRVERVERPVISIGNLTTGGTGKTPLVAFVTAVVSDNHKQPAIVSRGYKSLDGKENDEKRVLEILCSGVAHVQDRDRVAAAKTAIDEHGGEVIVADDAFQHRRLHRDLNIVLIDALNPWGHGFVLPRGLLREPKRQIRRADLVVLTRADQVSAECRDELWATIHQLKPEVCRIEVAFASCRLLGLDGSSKPIAELLDESNGEVSAFCGIGNPEAFRQTIQQAGFTLSQFQAFPDHHHYTESELTKLAQPSEMCLTTLKDLVKIDGLPDTKRQIWAVDIATTFLCGESEFRAAVSNLVTDH
jgi:tetraacyldisaccharide 4'-kinase